MAVAMTRAGRYNRACMAVESEVAPARDAASPAMPWLLLAAACLGSFAATASGTTRAPFLLDMARDLSVNLVLVANLVSMTATAWGITSFLAGMASDRWGRRPFLIGGPLGLSLCMLAVSQADGFTHVAFWATLGGGCSGLFMGVIFAEVAARVASSHRGRALSWVMSGQSLTLVVGVPLAAWIGATIQWRGWHVVLAGLAAAGALSLWAATVQGKASAAARRAEGERGRLSLPVIALLGISIAERVCYGLVVVYFATFLLEQYKVGLEAVAVPLALVAIGNVIGTAIGGQLADRLRDRLGLFAICMAATAVAGLALFAWRPDITVSVMLGFAYVFINALGRPSLMAALAEVPEDVRGTVMGLNGTCASVGWVGAAALGGWMLATWGFAGFGPLSAVLAVLGAAMAFAQRRF
ncbi:MFS transporter [Vineibacter terrae]|uniref:MFS transporter n=2 Tax=Vineibacter terrae TaxID=2586908 RepID=A0A5C8PNI2_9HYPH|nr:MFS transporter [Vineibacter terrae]